MIAGNTQPVTVPRLVDGSIDVANLKRRGKDGQLFDYKHYEGDASVTKAELITAVTAYQNANRKPEPTPVKLSQDPEAKAQRAAIAKAVSGNPDGLLDEIAPQGNVVALRPVREGAAPMLEKMSASQRGDLLEESLGKVAVSVEAGSVYRYTGDLWEPLTDAKLKRHMADIFKGHGVSYSDRVVNAAVETMKLSLDEMGEPSQDLIGFANGVYDMTAHQFRPHSPADGLLSHNGIVYSEPQAGETLEQNAPSFIKWLSHAAGGDAAKMARIKAALFMVLANRYDWQLFLEVTGEGGSGKSVMANLCGLLVGAENVGSSSMKRMESDFGLESVWDKRLIQLPDQPKYIGDGALLKAITGGDEVSINPKGKTIFSAKVRAVVMATNNEPMVMTERNGGIARRRVIFAFDRVVSEADKDPTIGDKIAAELPVIIRHLLAQFADPELAKRLLLEQRDGADALAVKREADPVIDLCAMLAFLDDPKGLMMGGGAAVKQEPRRYLYHLYLAYMEYQGLGKPLGVRAFGKAVRQAAKELKKGYLTRLVKGITQTNVALTEAAEVFIPQAVRLDD